MKVTSRKPMGVFAKVPKPADTRNDLPMPGIVTQVKGLAHSFYDIAKGIAQGKPLAVDPDTLDKRRAICAACPKYNPQAEKCSLCGCWRSLKPWFNQLSCPDKPARW